jgi:hypothetical protein
VLDNFSPHLSRRRTFAAMTGRREQRRTASAFLRVVADRIEAQFTALRYFALDGTDHPTHTEQAMIRRYIAWRNRHTTDPKLRKVVRRAETIKRAKVA